MKLYHVFFALFAVSASFAATVDLSQLAGDYNAKNGDVLTGTLDGENQHVKITIADGARVTLRDATINGVDGERKCQEDSKKVPCRWAGLTCLGDCTIELKGSNVVRGFYQWYPGIQAAKREGEGAEYTLTIEGDGYLEAISGGRSAGIGSGHHADCGNIVIRGGTVKAVGGVYAAAIGCGSNGDCGDITITNGVTKVVAIKRGSYHSIGAGDVGTIGKITIGGVVRDGSIEREVFVFPNPEAPVDFETAGGKTYAVIDGDYSGSDALNIPEDVEIDKVIFERTFPTVDGENNFSTIMFPFKIEARNISNMKQVFSFLGIGVNGKRRKFVAVERVWCDVQSKSECNYEYGWLDAYKPYLIQLRSYISFIYLNKKKFFEATPTDPSAFEVEQSEGYNTLGDYVFRSVIQGKTWGANDPEVLGTDDAAAYGFAGTATEDVDVGQFAKVGEGAYIRPFRGYIYKKPAPKKVKSNGDYVLRQTASIDDLPDVMDIVLVDRQKDGSERTTVIGQFNSRTGEIRMNRTERTYDLRGRSVRDANRMAKGVYLKK